MKIITCTAIAALGGLLFGYDTAIISGAVPFLQAYFRLDAYGVGRLVGCILIGCALGALSAGTLMERFGRQPVLIMGAVLFALAAVGVALAGAQWVFILFRIAGGVAVGTAAMVSPVYIAEIAPAAQRGRLVSVYQLAIVSGILLAYITGCLLSGTGANNWRWMFASQVIPALVFFFLLLPAPETPRWLVKSGQTGKAQDILEKMAGRDEAAREIQLIRQSFGHGSASLVALFATRHYRKILATGIIIAIFQQITGINAVLYYAPVIFKETGLSLTGALQQTVVIGAVNLLTTFIVIGLIDKAGRRRFLLTGSLVMAVSMAAMAVCFRQQYYGHYLVLICMLLYIAAFGATLGAVTWVYLSEIFPNRIKGFAMSAATLALWLADFLVTYTFPAMSQKLGTAKTLGIYAGCCVLSAGYIYCCLPETKGRQLEAIEQLFYTRKA